jgi:hypothetical protein
MDDLHRIGVEKYEVSDLICFHGPQVSLAAEKAGGIASGRFQGFLRV